MACNWDYGYQSLAGLAGVTFLARLIEIFIGRIPYAVVTLTRSPSHCVLLITGLHVTLGELVRNRLPCRGPSGCARGGAPMDFFLTVKGGTVVMSRAAGFVLRAFGSSGIRHGSVHSLMSCA